jgi:hypothetical protein
MDLPVLLKRYGNWFVFAAATPRAGFAETVFGKKTCGAVEAE